MSKADKFDKWFKSTYPEYCYGEAVIEPYYSIASYAWECAEQTLEVELTNKADTNHSLVEQMADLESENAELKEEVANLEGIKLAQGTALNTEYNIKEQLQKENAELKLQLQVEKDLHAEEVNLHLHAEDYIKSLEQENAELKATLTAGSIFNKSLNADNKCLTEERDKYRNMVFDTKEQLAQTTVWLKNLSDAFPNSYADVVKDTLEEVRQFLKEI